MTKEQKMEIALFRYGLIYPLVKQEGLDKAEKSAIRRQILSKKYDIPYSTKDSISDRRLREYVQLYREGGFNALIPHDRKDLGTVKAIPEEILERAIQLKREVPQRSVREIMDILELSGEIQAGDISSSTLARAISRYGSGIQVVENAQHKVFKRYQKQRVNEVWQSDIKHGIYIKDPNNPKEYIKTYLIVFLDDKSRRAYGRIYTAENTHNLEDCLRHALIAMGIPECIYTDNGKVYRSKRLQLICAQLGSMLKYCHPYAPQSKGKVEKFMWFVDRSFEPEARKLGIETTDQLNEYFSCWLEENYNKKLHSEIGMTPMEAFEAESANITYESIDALKEAFMQTEVRRVNKTALISLNGNTYQVESRLAGKQVEVRYDPKDLYNVMVYYNGQRFEDAQPFMIKNNVWDYGESQPYEHKDENSASNNAGSHEPISEQNSYLKLLKKKNDASLRSKAHRIAYTRLYAQEGDDSSQCSAGAQKGSDSSQRYAVDGGSNLSGSHNVSKEDEPDV